MKTLCYFLVLSLGASMWMGCLKSQKAEETDTFNQHFTPFADVITERGEGNVAETLIKAMQYYNSQQHKQAIPLFEELLQVNPENDTILFYSAVSHLAENKASIAVDQLEKVCAQSESAFYSNGLWYLGLAYLRTEEDGKAAYMFAKIEEGKSSYQQKASGILTELAEVEPVEPFLIPPPKVIEKGGLNIAIPTNWKVSENPLSVYKHVMGTNASPTWMMEMMDKDAVLFEHTGKKVFVLLFDQEDEMDTDELNDILEEGIFESNGTEMSLWGEVKSEDQLSFHYNYKGTIAGINAMIYGIARQFEQGTPIMVYGVDPSQQVNEEFQQEVAAFTHEIRQKQSGEIDDTPVARKNNE